MWRQIANNSGIVFRLSFRTSIEAMELSIAELLTGPLIVGVVFRTDVVRTVFLQTSEFRTHEAVGILIRQSLSRVRRRSAWSPCAVPGLSLASWSSDSHWSLHQLRI